VNNWRIHLEYDGAGYSGWQLQPNAPTVQHYVQAALSKVLGGSDFILHASGRTDAGVHALGQVCSFSTQAERKPSQIRDGLNALMPPDVSCWHAERVEEDFHARYSVVGKLYRYRIRTVPARSALGRGRSWHHRKPLDVQAMSQALQGVIGTHDFSSFRGQGCTARSPVRELQMATVEQGPNELVLEFYGTGFLRRMVRNLVGSAAQVGVGRKPPEWMVEVLNKKDRNQAGPGAPSCGLYLVRVDY
jgi:tRNA pseudouridine38-40 synthase